MYGSLCWQGYDKDTGGFKKMMWYSIMKEFNCKVYSTAKYDRAKDAAFTQRKHGNGGQGKVSQMDHIIEPQEMHDEYFILQ